MAAKIDLKKHGGRVKGAGDVPDTADGNAPNTGMPKAVAPDVISAPRAAKSGYGQNGWAKASSLTPNDNSNDGVSPLAANMKAAGERGSDPVLDAIIQKGSAAMSIDPTGDAVTAAEGVTGSQIRKIAATNVPDAYGMASARSRQPTYPGPAQSVPDKLVEDNGEPVRKPGA